MPFGDSELGLERHSRFVIAVGEDQGLSQGRSHAATLHVDRDRVVEFLRLLQVGNRTSRLASHQVRHPTQRSKVGRHAWRRLRVIQLVRDSLERHESYGIFIFLKAGATGLMPLEETGSEREGDLKKLFPVGSSVDVLVLEADAAGRRIRLSRKAVLDAKEKQEAREYADRESAAQAGGFGNLAETLRKALDKRGK